MVAETGLQKGIKKADTFQYPFLIFLIGRGSGIRTHDILLPKQALYQAEPYPDSIKHQYHNQIILFGKPFLQKIKPRTEQGFIRS